MKKRTKTEKQDMIDFISSNLHMSNVLLAEKFNMTTNGIVKIMQRNSIKRTEEQLLELRKEYSSKGGLSFHSKYNIFGENNFNWKDGISLNNYHYTKIQRQRYPEKTNARRKVRYALKSGKLIKGKCEHYNCNDSNTYAHHEDYSKPLDVNWLCRKHHREKHDNKH